ncbi:MAG TPA: molybdenum cofactor guanylyltransferase [Puia sp.]|jgi:molybdopterin-guanine dinucleotide biosynthesis protein A|nr:molybdenum cofactor guanylyltransferase [Puia sp.]
MLGIVLCGGTSSRMGRDKGLLLSTNGTWAKKMLNNLRELGITSALSVNSNQFEQYATEFTKTELIVDSDLILLKGPLAAVLSVHAKYPLEDLFVTACDMPLMDTIVLKELFNNYLKDSGKACFVFTNEGEPEPLCGIYSAKGLAKIKTMYDGGQLVRHSMKFILDHLVTSLIPIPENWKIYFKNVNAHADLNGL